MGATSTAMATARRPSSPAMIMHQCPVSTSEKKMIEFLADLNHQKRLMTSCSEALRACTLCAMKATEEGLDCVMHCGSCATMLEVSLKYLASRTSHCKEVVALSAKIAKSCSDHCSQHQNPTARTAPRLAASGHR